MKNLKVGDILIDKMDGEKFEVVQVEEKIFAVAWFDKVSWYKIDDAGLHFTLKEQKWVPELGKSYYFLDDMGDVNSSPWDCDLIDKWRLKTGNFFPYTEEGKVQAEEYREKLINLGK